MSFSAKIFFLLVFLTLGFAYHASLASAATRYWVGGGSSSSWSATGNTNWGTASGVRDNASVPTATDDVIFDNSANGNTPCIIAATANAKSVNFTGWTNTLSHGPYTLMVSGSVNFSAGMTYNITSVSAGITLQAAGSTATTSGQIMPNITLTANAGVTLADNLTTTSTRATTFTLSSGATLNLNGKTLSGGSSINRLLITTNAIGSSRTITMNGGTFAYADFRDIAFDNGGANLDLSAITGLSGDAGGNTMSGGGTLTMTATSTQNWTNTAGGNWSLATNWTSRVPLPQDDVTFNVAMQTAKTITIDMPRIGKSIDFTSMTYTGTKPTIASNILPNVFTLYGSLTLQDQSLYTWTASSNIWFEGRGAYTLTTGGKSFANGFFPNAYGGSLTLQDSLTTAGAFSPKVGTVNVGVYNVTAYSSGFADTPNLTVNMGSGTWTITGAGQVFYTYSVANSVINAETSTLVFSNTSASAKTVFYAAGRSWNIVTFSGDNITIVASQTFATMNVNNAGLANGLKITSGTTQTITGSFTTNGSAGNLAKLLSSTTGSAGTLSKTSGTVAVDYMSIQDSTASGGATWYAGSHSANVSGNSGWIFGDQSGARPPAAPSETVRGRVKARGGVKFR